jgi:hypothetical protein
MRLNKLHLAAVVSITAFTLLSCSKGGSSGGGGGNTTPAPQVTLNKTSITADGWETVTFTAKDQSNNDITTSCVFYVDNQIIQGSAWWTNATGNHTVKAVRSGVESASVTINATSPGASPFSQKIIVEDYTGTWCGHCPRVGMNLETYLSVHPNMLVVANHGPSNDPYTFSGHGLLASYFHVTGYPTAVVNRDFDWNENYSQLDQQFTNRRPPLGIAFQTSVSGNSITGTAKIKYDVNTSVPLKIVLYLVEDGKVYPQVNYNYFGLPNPINSYTHNSILRKTLTGLYGDNLPVANQTKGGITDFAFTVDATGYDISKCRIVGFVVHGTNNQNRKENAVVNAQTVKAGLNKDFD